MKEYELKDFANKKRYGLQPVQNPGLGEWMLSPWGDYTTSNSPIYFDCLHDVETFLKESDETKT